MWASTPTEKIGKLCVGDGAHTVPKSQIDKGFVRFIAEYGGRLAIKGMPEAFENGAQAILDAVFEHIIAGEELDIDWGEVAYEALAGFATSVILNAPQEYADTALANAGEVGYNQKNIVLQEQLNYEWNGEKLFLPKDVEFDTVVAIAGYDTNTPIRSIERLTATYGGKLTDWHKMAGKITSERYTFDVHWYESAGKQYEVKLKYRKEILP